MTITAIVCTRTRPEMMPECLSSLSGNRYADLEILVIDQSTDPATAEAVSRAAERDSRIRYVPTTTIGLSRARNTGVRLSRGEIIAFTDDDCVVDPNWVAAMVEEFQSDPSVSAVYGRSLPFENALADEHVVAVKTDTRHRTFAGRCNPWKLGNGNNMAFRRRVFDTVGWFDEALGPGGILRNADDADFTYRMLKAGFQAVYSPEPLVYHKQFRHGEDFRRLHRDYEIGAGALCCKHLRCGDWYALKLALDRWLVAGAMRVFYGLLTMRRAYLMIGWYRIAYSVLGMLMARHISVNVLRRVFADPNSGGQSDAQEQHLRSHLHAR